MRFIVFDCGGIFRSGSVLAAPAQARCVSSASGWMERSWVSTTLWILSGPRSRWGSVGAFSSASMSYRMWPARRWTRAGVCSWQIVLPLPFSESERMAHRTSTVHGHTMCTWTISACAVARTRRSRAIWAWSSRFSDVSKSEILVKFYQNFGVLL